MIVSDVVAVEVQPAVGKYVPFQEVIAAGHSGMDVFAMSVVTDLGIREEDNIITHEEVLQAAREAEPKLAFIFKELIASI